jgi:pyrroloquinoline-quinone synthase
MNPRTTFGRKTQTDSTHTHAAMCLREAGCDENPYFANLANGTMSRKGFARSQQQFYFVVAAYPRALGIMMSRITEPLDRNDLVGAMIEWQGGGNASHSHQYSMQKLLQCLGEPLGVTACKTAMHPTVHSFNSVLAATCSFDEWEVGLACLGVVELGLARAFVRIDQAVVERAFVPGEEPSHFRLHGACHAKNADNFLLILNDSWRDKSRRDYVERGLALGAHVVDRLFGELLVITSAA